MSSALSSPRTLFRVARIVESGHTQKTLSEDGCLELTAGKHYTLEIAHYQPLPSGASDVALVVSTANGVDLLTSQEVPLKSRYDVVPIPFFAPARDSEIQGELTITTRPPNLGAAVRLPTSVKPPTSQVLMNPMVAVVGAVLAVAPATMGDGVAAGLKFAIAGIGAVLATNMLWWRRRRALPT